MIYSRVHAAWLAFCHPDAVHHPESLRTSAVEVINSTMDAAIAATRFDGGAGDDDWWMGAMAAQAVVRSQLVSLKMKLLMETAYPEKETA